jgi:hypothetical protein
MVRPGPSVSLRATSGLLAATTAVLVALVLGIAGSAAATSGAAASSAASSGGATPLGAERAQTATTLPPEGDGEGSPPAESGDPAEGSDPAATEPTPVDEPIGEAPPTTLPSTTTPALEERVTESDRATTRLNRVVIGLLVLAAVIAAATVYFWFRTRPSRPSRDAEAPTRRVRTGAVVVRADGSEQPLVDPGPAALVPEEPGAADPWAVAPPPQLVRRRPGTSGLAQAGTSAVVPGPAAPPPALPTAHSAPVWSAPAETAPTPGSAPSEPGVSDAGRADPDPADVPSWGSAPAEPATWWASQAGEVGSGEVGARDER